MAIYLPETISVRVDLQFHGYRDVVSVLDNLKRRRSLSDLTILLVGSLVLRSLDSRAWIPAELVPEGVISLLCYRETATVALVGNNLIALSFGFIFDFNSAHNIDAGIKTDLIEKD